MREQLHVMVLFTSLGSYFPERHGVFERARLTLGTIVFEAGAVLTIYDGVITTRVETEAALAAARRSSVDFLLVLHGGFTMGEVAHTLALSEFRLGFWAVPEPVFEGDIQLNNFVSLNMSSSIVRKLRKGAALPAAWYFGTVDDPGFVAPFRNTLSALRMLRAVEGCRVGRVGGLAPGFHNMEVSGEQLSANLGCSLVEYPLDDLKRRADRIPTGRIESEVAAMRRVARVNCDWHHLELSARYALAMVELMDNDGLDALTVSDWPELQVDPGFHPGAAFSWVEECYRRAIASEGDVMGALTQRAALAATGKAGCLLDLCAPDPASGRLLVWHGGGGPLHLGTGDPSSWVDHPMLGRGDPAAKPVGTILDMILADGSATLVRLGEAGATVFAVEGDIVTGDAPGFVGVRGWFEAQEHGRALSLDALIDRVMSEGVEHHFTLVPGHWGAAFEELARWRGMRWQSGSSVSLVNHPIGAAGTPHDHA